MAEGVHVVECAAGDEKADDAESSQSLADHLAQGRTSASIAHTMIGERFVKRDETRANLEALDHWQGSR